MCKDLTKRPLSFFPKLIATHFFPRLTATQISLVDILFLSFFFPNLLIDKIELLYIYIYIYMNKISFIEIKTIENFYSNEQEGIQS
jgi:hypothetical protein